MKPQIESFFDDRSAVDWGGYTWGPQLFPEPEALLTSLAKWCACFLRLFAPFFATVYAKNRRFAKTGSGQT
jgi:hypothetical protein